MGSILWSETKQEKWLMLCICSVLTIISCTLNFYNIFISVCGIFEKEVFNYRPEILETWMYLPYFVMCSAILWENECWTWIFNLIMVGTAQSVAIEALSWKILQRLQCIKQRFLSCRTEKIATFFLHRENSYLFPAMIQQQ